MEPDEYLLDREDRGRLVGEILGLDLPVIEWDQAEEELIQARGEGLP